MNDPHHRPQPITAKSLPAYFHSELGKAAANQGHKPGDAALWYLTDLLTRFARSDHFFDFHDGHHGLRPLALLYGEAIQAPNEQQRQQLFQRLGDVSMFVAGLFAESLNKRAVRREYFVGMGCCAYGYLADNNSAAKAVFEELSGDFVQFVNLLAMLGQNRRLFDSHDILRLYELWRDTGSRQAASQLRLLGVSLPEDTQAATVQLH